MKAPVLFAALLLAVVLVSGCAAGPPREPPGQTTSVPETTTVQGTTTQPTTTLPGPSIPTVAVVKDSSGRRSSPVNQLTGETEVRYEGTSCTQTPTLSRTVTTAGFRGTDLGNSFNDDSGRTWFLFGDTTKDKSNTVNYGACPNSVAFLKSVDSQGRIELKWVTDSAGNFKKLTTQGENPTCFDVPTDGVFANGKYYVWFTGKNNPQQEKYLKKFAQSYLSKTTDLSTQTTLTKVYQVSQNNDCVVQATEKSPKTTIPDCTPVTGHFITTTADVVTESGQEMLYVFGDGPYRRGDVYLYRMPLTDIEDRSAISYFAGLVNGQPTWSAQESDAAVTIDTPGGEESEGCAGEISVTYNKQLGMWLTLNNCGGRGIVLHTAANPWGPWSESQTIFHPAEDKGFTDFMYNKALSPPCLSGSGQNAGKNAGPYGPAIVEPRTKTNADGTVDIFYAMSTWNPYQAMLMRARLRPQ